MLLSKFCFHLSDCKIEMIDFIKISIHLTVSDIWNALLICEFQVKHKFLCMSSNPEFICYLHKIHGFEASQKASVLATR